MARSSRLAVLLLVPGAVACTGILGLSDYEKVDCTPGLCGDGGGSDAGTDARDAETGALDAAGSGPVQWPQFRMPNYAQDGGPDANIVSYSTIDPETVLDNVSKLVWRRVVPPQEQTFAEAGRFCRTVGGLNERWRLPSRIELVTLLDLGKEPAINADFKGPLEGQPTRGSFWTSSEVRPYAGSRWTVSFGPGIPGPRPATETTLARVRCVKDVP